MGTIERNTDDGFLYNPKKTSLELDESLEEAIYYDQLLVLTAIASYNREEGLGKIRGKQAMLGEKDMNIHLHCLAYDVSKRLWGKFFEGEIDLKSFFIKVHEILLHGVSIGLTKIIPGMLRTDCVFISGESGEVSDAIFINPAPKYIEEGIIKIEEYIKKSLKNPQEDIKNLAGKLHYLIAILHPFQDGNGRLARILSISLLEYFGMKDARGFTFMSEMLNKKKGSKIDYEDCFDYKNGEKLAHKIKEKGVTKKYDVNGKSSYKGNENIPFQEYISFLNIEQAGMRFTEILFLLQENREIISVLVEIFLKAKTLHGDHKLVWKFISLLFDGIENKINSGKEIKILIDENIILGVITKIDGKLNKTSVKNLLILINHFQKSLGKLGIYLSVSERFYTQALKDGILGDDIITQGIKGKVGKLL